MQWLLTMMLGQNLNRSLEIIEGNAGFIVELIKKMVKHMWVVVSIWVEDLEIISIILFLLKFKIK